MTSDADAQQQDHRRQIALMVYLGELVAVEDPVTGELYYMATQRLRDMAEGRRCDAGIGTCHRPRRTEEAPRSPSWRLRAALNLLAVGLALSAVLPTVVSTSSRAGVHRVVDDLTGTSVNSASRSPVTVSAV